jgi:hypothetical protein
MSKSLKWMIGAKSKKNIGTFKFSIQTTTPNETFTLPISIFGKYNFIVNWGDGSLDNAIISYNDPNRIHTYITVGSFIITMTGFCTWFCFSNTGDRLKVKQLIEFTGDMGFLYLNFYGCNNLTTI